MNMSAKFLIKYMLKENQGLRTIKRHRALQEHRGQPGLTPAYLGHLPGYWMLFYN